MTGNHPLDPLRIADPDTYVWVRGQVEMLQPSPTDTDLARLADETIWGLSLESAMGAAYARGIIMLLGSADGACLDRYIDLVRDAARTGATLGRIVAEFAAAVTAAGEPLTALFQSTMAVMLEKGTYTLTAPFELLKELLQDQAEASAAAYLKLLSTTFDRPLTYNQSLQLVYLLPKSIRRFAPHRRRFQIDQLTRVVRHDVALMEAFLEGLTKALGLLDKDALGQFCAMGLERHTRNPAMGISFFSLSSKVAQDICMDLQRAILLKQAGGPLGRYLAARLGRPVAVASMSVLGDLTIAGQWVCSDGVQIYVPEEVSPYPRRDRNVAFLKTLVRLEAALFEFGTFDFDLERAIDQYPELLAYRDEHQDGAGRDNICDGERFISRFPIPDLAADLFSLFEFARHRRLTAHHYPALLQRADAFIDNRHAVGADHLLAPVIDTLLCGKEPSFGSAPELEGVQKDLIALFETQFHLDNGVETSAVLVNRAYARLAAARMRIFRKDTPLAIPLGRRLRWDLVSKAMTRHAQRVQEIKVRLSEQGVDVYRSDLSRRLADQHGRLSPDDVVELVVARNRVARRPSATVTLSPRQLEMLLQKTGTPDPGPRHRNDSGFRYPEWDCTVQDYLFDHTRVHAVHVAGDDGGDYYQRILTRRGGLVARIRTAFELLKPQGMAMLRQWPEGDALDYRAMLDYVMDRRAGRMPSDRLFIKRLKQERDVAVQLLVDLSRSTANPVVSGDATVLDVTKEALVLFCEALDVVGDRYAIAGFSGAGRHAVDYYHIKRFDEPLHADIQARIAALAPQRSTRMGAAVRHATAAIADAPHRVRLIILISDGFPNDLGYKADYAIADTRKAITEARAKNVHVKAITVNIGSDPGLDALYGRVHHHVIGDVLELPDKLLSVYGTLTRN